MDQNSNMGGFAPMPGQTGMGGNDTVVVPDGFQAAPAAAPMPGAAPMNTMPNMAAPAAMPGMPAPAMPAAAPGVAPINPAVPQMNPTAAPNAATAAAGKKDTTMIETIILVIVCLIAAAAIVFAVIFFMKYNELNTDFESQKSIAEANARVEQEEADIAKFEEEKKLPFQKFTGPSDYGSISFEYPKTWSIYVESDGTDNSDYVAYFRPGQVDPVGKEDSRYALRFKIMNQQITSVQEEYEGLLEDGSVTSSVFNADNNKVTGTMYTGKIAENMNGIVVLIKVNDKTAIFQTDAMIYKNDFQTLISKIRRNS